MPSADVYNENLPQYDLGLRAQVLYMYAVQGLSQKDIAEQVFGDPSRNWNVSTIVRAYGLGKDAAECYNGRNPRGVYRRGVNGHQLSVNDFLGFVNAFPNGSYIETKEDGQRVYVFDMWYNEAHGYPNDSDDDYLDDEEYLDDADYDDGGSGYQSYSQEGAGSSPGDTLGSLFTGVVNGIGEKIHSASASSNQAGYGAYTGKSSSTRTKAGKGGDGGLVGAVGGFVVLVIIILIVGAIGWRSGMTQSFLVNLAVIPAAALALAGVIDLFFFGLILHDLNAHVFAVTYGISLLIFSLAAIFETGGVLAGIVMAILSIVILKNSKYLRSDDNKRGGNKRRSKNKKRGRKRRR